MYRESVSVFSGFFHSVISACHSDKTKNYTFQTETDDKNKELLAVCVKAFSLVMAVKMYLY